MKILLLFFLIVLSSCSNAEGKENKISINICSQNLFNYGELDFIRSRRKGLSKQELNQQTDALVTRFKKNNCDIIAVQEVMAPNQKSALKVLDKLASKLDTKSNKFLVLAAKSNDTNSKLGFLINSNKFKVVKAKSYYREILPKLFNYDRNRYFSRGPFEVQLEGITSQTKLTLYNFHFKSKAAFHRYDKSNHGFEYDRMIMAEALNEIAEKHTLNNPDNIIVLLGDRNSTYGSASEQILNGEYTLEQFRNRDCDVFESGESSCPNTNKDKFVSIINEDPDLDLISLITRSKKLIDDILVSKKDLTFFLENQNKSGDYQIKIERFHREASDHPMLKATFQSSLRAEH